MNQPQQQFVTHQIIDQAELLLAKPTAATHAKRGPIRSSQVVTRQQPAQLSLGHSCLAG